MTLHLSPTSTANVIVTSAAPQAPSDVGFLKLSPDAEIIVAPKARPRLARSNKTETSSTISGGRRSATGRSYSGSTRQKSSKASFQRSLFLRGLDQSVLSGPVAGSQTDQRMTVYVDKALMTTELFRDSVYVVVSIVSSNAIHLSQELQDRLKHHERGEEDAPNQIAKFVTKILEWPDAPDNQHVLLSPYLAKVIGIEHMAGCIVRVEPAPGPLRHSGVVTLNVIPFLPPGAARSENIKFGGETRASKDLAAQMIKSIYGDARKGLLRGPLTAGLTLVRPEDDARDWHGGVVYIEHTKGMQDRQKAVVWVNGEETDFNIQVQQAVTAPLEPRKNVTGILNALPLEPPSIVGNDTTILAVVKNLLHGSSVLVTGGLGSGKTSVARAIAHRLRKEHLFHISYLSCRKLLSDDIRTAVVSEALEKLFMTAIYGTRLGGKSLIILDDLDKICPVETELQIGNENQRSRQISELFRSTVSQTCQLLSNISLLVTAQSKDNLHQVITGGHVVRETAELKAPTKQIRSQILELHLVQKLHRSKALENSSSNYESTANPDRRSVLANEWDGQVIAPHTAQRSVSDIDFLDIASRTDGYMPGDLQLLLSRAQGEALTRCLYQCQGTTVVELATVDFIEALKDFTPASLRNVTLQTSTTTFDSIGGLRLARRTLLETLQYPTIYAPIFNQCPLRLRSGLLLYGYPGCGKTLLASAVAGECGLNFISVKGPEILNKYIGASEKSVRDLFDRAQAAKPCVLFFDEFDSIAPKRGHDSTGVTDRVVNQLLTQMDGAEGLSGVYVLAATSRPDLIDPALLRPGRLDKSLLCDMPSLEDRLDILRAVSRDLKMSAAVLSDDHSAETLREVAERTTGYTGADLQAVLYNAHLQAIHDMLGEQKSSRPAAQDMRVTGSEGRLQSTTHRELVHFLFGQGIHQPDSPQDLYPSHVATQKIAKLEAMDATLLGSKLARRKDRARRLAKAEVKNNAAGVTVGKGPDVIIEWKHIKFSLQATKSSMSMEERRKLERVYGEFQTARNGEMPSGQASREVGARSSLM